MKIRVSDVFDNINDIRKDMSIGMNDEANKQYLADNLGIGTFDIDQILENAQIYFDGSLMNKFIEVQGMNDDMKELKARLLTIDEYSKMFAHNDNPDIPDAYSTIPEIKDYLDRQGIDYTGARLKGQLLELIPSK